MKKQLSDPFEFARNGARLDGEVDAREFEGLADVLPSTATAQWVRFSLVGERAGDKHFIHIRLAGELNLSCQRCLEDLKCLIETDGHLLLVPSSVPLPDEEMEEDGFDAIHVSQDFDVLTAVEEELLLALPVAPVHAYCKVPGGVEHNDKESPFALLRGLKQSGSE